VPKASVLRLASGPLSADDTTVALGALMPRAPAQFWLRHREGLRRLARSATGRRPGPHDRGVPAPGARAVALVYALARLLDAWQGGLGPWSCTVTSRRRTSCVLQPALRSMCSTCDAPLSESAPCAPLARATTKLGTRPVARQPPGNRPTAMYWAWLSYGWWSGHFPLQRAPTSAPPRERRPRTAQILRKSRLPLGKCASVRCRWSTRLSGRPGRMGGRAGGPSRCPRGGGDKQPGCRAPGRVLPVWGGRRASGRKGLTSDNGAVGSRAHRPQAPAAGHRTFLRREVRARPGAQPPCHASSKRASAYTGRPARGAGRGTAAVRHGHAVRVAGQVAERARRLSHHGGATRTAPGPRIKAPRATVVCRARHAADGQAEELMAFARPLVPLGHQRRPAHRRLSSVNGRGCRVLVDHAAGSSEHYCPSVPLENPALAPSASIPQPKVGDEYLFNTPRGVHHAYEG